MLNTEGKGQGDMKSANGKLAEVQTMPLEETTPVHRREVGWGKVRRHDNDSTLQSERRVRDATCLIGVIV